VPWLGSASVAVLTVSGSPSGSLSLPSRFTTVATPGAAAWLSSTASGAGFTGSIVIVPVKVPPLPSSTVTGMTASPTLSTGGVPLSIPVSGLKLAQPGRSTGLIVIVRVSPVLGSVK